MLMYGSYNTLFQRPYETEVGQTLGIGRSARKRVTLAPRPGPGPAPTLPPGTGVQTVRELPPRRGDVTLTHVMVRREYHRDLAVRTWHFTFRSLSALKLLSCMMIFNKAKIYCK